MCRSRLLVSAVLTFALSCAAPSLAGDGTGATRVRVTQTGYEESDRWRRYYEVIGFGWERALASLRNLLEK